MKNFISLAIAVSVASLITHSTPSEARTKIKKGLLISMKAQSIQSKACTNPVSAQPDTAPPTSVLLAQGEIKVLNQGNSNSKTFDFILKTEFSLSQPGNQSAGSRISYEPWTWKDSEAKSHTIENYCFTPNAKDLGCFKKQINVILKSTPLTLYFENPSDSPLHDISITYFPGLSPDEKVQEIQDFKKKWVFQGGDLFISFGEDSAGHCLLSDL